MTVAIVFLGAAVLALGACCAVLNRRVGDLEASVLECRVKLDKALHPAYRPGLRELARDLTEEARRGK